MDADLDFSCFNFDQGLPELGTCEELQDDAQNEILMAYPLYVTLLKNMRTMKKVLDDKTRLIKKLKTSRQDLQKEVVETKSKLAVALEDVDRLTDNLRMRLEEFASERERLETNLMANNKHVEQLELLVEANKVSESDPSTKQRFKVRKETPPPSPAPPRPQKSFCSQSTQSEPPRLKKSQSMQTYAQPAKSMSVQTDPWPEPELKPLQEDRCVQTDPEIMETTSSFRKNQLLYKHSILEEDPYGPLQHLESPVSMDLDPCDRGELESEFMHPAEDMEEEHVSLDACGKDLPNTGFAPQEEVAVENHNFASEVENSAVTLEMSSNISYCEPLTLECDKTELPSTIFESENGKSVSKKEMLFDQLFGLDVPERDSSEDEAPLVIVTDKEQSSQNSSLSDSPLSPLAEDTSSDHQEPIIIPQVREEPELPTPVQTPEPEVDLFSDQDLQHALEEVTFLPTLIEPLSPMMQQHLKRKLRSSPPEKPKKISKLNPVVELPEEEENGSEEICLLDDKLVGIITNPLSPIKSDLEEEQQVPSEEPDVFGLADKLKVPEQMRRSAQDAKQILNKINPGSYVYASSIYKNHLACLTVLDEFFNKEMLETIFKEINELPSHASVEILAKAFLLPLAKDTKDRPLVPDKKPFPMTSTERRTVFVIKSVEEKCQRWRGLSAAVSTEAIKVLLTTKRLNYFSFGRKESMVPTFSRLITALSMLAKDPSLAKGLLQMSTMYAPQTALTFGTVVLDVWPEALRLDSEEDVPLLRCLWHVPDKDKEGGLRQLLRSKYGEVLGQKLLMAPVNKLGRQHGGGF